MCKPYPIEDPHGPGGNGQDAGDECPSVLGWPKNLSACSPSVWPKFDFTPLFLDLEEDYKSQLDKEDNEP